MYKYHIGIDVSKSFFDVALHNSAQKPARYANNSKGIAEFLQTLVDIKDRLFVVLEATGGYENHLLQSLVSAQIAVHRADPTQSSFFIKSLGNKGKTDMSDAKALARYGFERCDRLPLFRMQSDTQNRLKQLTARYDDLVQMRVQEKNRLSNPNYKEFQDDINLHLHFIDSRILEIEREMNDAIKSDPTMKQVYEIIQEIDGVGPKTARTFLAFLPELGTLDRRKIAALAGVAPHPKDSGKRTGYRQTKGGRSLLKKTLFTASLAAVRTKNSTISTFYNNAVARGLKPIKAIVAVMRKIVVISNAKVKSFFQQQAISR
jgi:transposase